MKLTVVKDTLEPSGLHTLTLKGEEGAHGEIFIPGNEFEVGQEFTLVPATEPEPEELKEQP